MHHKLTASHAVRRQRWRLGRFWALATLLLGGLAGAVQSAEQPTGANPPPPTAPAQEGRSAPADNPEGAEDAEQQEVFLPSEEISEDFAVPFPVDI